MLGATIHRAASTGSLPERAALTAYSERIAARPAFQRAWKRDAEIAAAKPSG